MASSWSAKQQDIKDKIEAAERVLKSVNNEGVGNSSAEAGTSSGFTEIKYFYSKSPVRIKSCRRRPRAYVKKKKIEFSSSSALCEQQDIEMLSDDVPNQDNLLMNSDSTIEGKKNSKSLVFVKLTFVRKLVNFKVT